MSVWFEIRERVRALLFRSSEERELEEEMRFHIAQETEKNLRAGLDLVEARRRAVVAFGGVDRFTEQVREARGVLWVENVQRDLRFAARALRRNPGFTATAVLTLAVGVGAVTTVFALANWLLIRPVPGVESPNELVTVLFEDAPGQPTGISDLNIAELAAGTPALSGLVGQQGAAIQAVGPDGAPFNVQGSVVQGDYFGVLGVRTRLGRSFSEEERSTAGTGDVVMVSENFWRSRLGGASDVVGKTLGLNAETYTIVGVVDAFQGIDPTEEVEVWLTPPAYYKLRHASMSVTGRAGSARVFFQVIGRLRPGASPEQAQEQLRAGMRGLVERYPDENSTYESHPPTVYAGVGLEVLVRDRTVNRMRLLLGIASLLLLLATANVANLLLFRGVSRHAETSMRRALGASAPRLLQQQITEGLVLSLVGGGAGVASAVLFREIVEGQRFVWIPVIDRLVFDWRVVGFALAGALAAGVLATMLPTIVALRGDPHAGTKETPSSSGTGAKTRAGLMILQIAVSLTLLVGALQLVRTVRQLGAVELGFDPEQVHTFGYSTTAQGYDAQERLALDQRVLERMRGLPGVQSVTLASEGPSTSFNTFRLSVPGSGADPVSAIAFAVSAEYFTTLGLPLLAGRSFRPDEEFASSPASSGVVLSATAAEDLFGTTQAVGRSVTMRVLGTRVPVDATVIGVTGEFREGFRDEAKSAVHLPLGSVWHTSRLILVRSALTAPETERLVSEAFADVAPTIPFNRVETLSDAMSGTISGERLLARVLGTFAWLAAVLAGIGLYGVVAYSVARRKREIGIRISLGASGRSVVGLVTRQGMTLVTAGVLFGAVGGYVLSRALASSLFGVTLVDPVTYGLAIAGFAIVAGAACAIPARGATRLNPVATLKAE